MASYRAGTARTYALVGFVFYLIGLIALMFGVFAFLLLYAVPAPATPFPFGAFPVILIFLIILAIWIGLTVWAWSTVRQIEVGRYGEARTNSLILGIVGLFFGLLIGGIFFLLAYSELGAVMTVPPQAQRFCPQCGRQVPPDAKFCPHCGRELPP